MIRFLIRPAGLLAAVIALATACNSTEPLPLLKASIARGQVGANATPDGIQVYNGTDSPSPYFLFAIERETAARIDWMPCTGGPACPSVMPGERLTLPWSSIAGYSNTRHEYLVYSWRVARSADGTLAVTGMQYLLVLR